MRPGDLSAGPRDGGPKRRKNHSPSDERREARRAARFRTNDLARAARELYDKIHDAGDNRIKTRLAGQHNDALRHEGDLNELFDRKRDAQAEPTVSNVEDLRLAQRVGDFRPDKPGGRT
jgi:hypothetical protein